MKTIVYTISFVLILLICSCCRINNVSKLDTKYLYELIDENKIETLYYSISGLDIFLIDKELAIKTALVVDSVLHNDYLLIHYGTYLNDKRLASRLINIFETQDLKLNSNNYNLTSEFNIIFNSLNNQNPEYVLHSLKTSHKIWNKRVIDQKLLSNQTSVSKGWEYFCLQRLLFISDILLGNNCTEVNLDEFNHNLNEFKSMGGKYIRMQSNVSNFNIENGSLIKLIKPIQSLHNIDLCDIATIREVIRKDYQNNNSHMIYISNDTRALFQASNEYLSVTYFIKIIDKKHIKVTLLKSFIS